MKKLLLAGLSGLALAVAGSANAADIGVGPVYSPAAPAIVPLSYFSWTGPYVGVNVGGGWENARTDYSYSSIPTLGLNDFEDVFGPTGTLNVPGQSAVASALTSGFLPTSLGKKAAGFFTAGGQMGINFQMAQIVFGLEGDFEWLSGVKTTTFVAPPNIALLTNTFTQTVTQHWLGTLRARAGYAFYRALIFATGGVAFGRATSTTNVSMVHGPNIDLFSGSGGSHSTGFVVGGGIEYALTDYLTAKAEYLYYNLGTVNYQVAPVNSFAVGEGLSINARHRFDGNILRLGLNYKFEWL